MSVVVSIDGENIELAPGTTIAQSLKAFSVGNITERNFNFTNGIKAPHTPNNDRIFQSAGDPASETLIPYRIQRAVITSNGIETESNGVHKLRSVDSSGYDIYITSGAKSFFETLGDQMLSDLPDFALFANHDYMVTRRNATTGLVFPVAYYGTQATNDPPDGITKDIYVDPGAIYLEDIIEAIFVAAGYTKSGSVFSDSKYLKTAIMALGKKGQYVDSFIENRRVEVYSQGQGPTLVAGGGTPVEFTGVRKSGSNPQGYWDGTDTYLVNQSGFASGVIIYYLKYKYTINIIVSGGTVNIRLDAFSSFINVGTGTYSFDATAESPLYAAAYNITGLQMNIDINSGTPTVTIISGSLSIFPHGMAYSNAFVNQPILFASLLPDIRQADLIVDLAVGYGLIPKEKNNIVYWKSFDDIIADRTNAVDWTARRVNKERDALKFTPLGYARNNYIRYQAAENVSEQFGQGLFTVDNDNIDPEKTVYTSPFENIESILKADFGFTDYILMANMQVYEESPLESPTTFNFKRIYNNSIGNKMVLIREPYAGDHDVDFLDDGGTTYTPYSDYLVAYFDDSMQDDSLVFQQSVDDNYPLFVECLQRAKIVTREYNLTELDIANFDFFLPIFDSGEYYLVNEITTFISGRATKVELFRC